MLRIEDRMSALEHPLLLDQLKEYQKQNRDLILKNQVLNFQMKQAGEEIQKKYEAQMRLYEAERKRMRVNFEK